MFNVLFVREERNRGSGREKKRKRKIEK